MLDPDPPSPFARAPEPERSPAEVIRWAARQVDGGAVLDPEQIAMVRAALAEAGGPEPVSRLLANIGKPGMENSEALRKAAPEVAARIEEAQALPAFQPVDDPAPIQWLLPRWLLRGEVTLFSGAAAMGKTTLALQIAAAVADAKEAAWLAGQPYRLHAPEGGHPVVYGGWEDRPDAVSQLIADNDLQSMDRERRGGRLHMLNLRGWGPVYGPAGFSGHMATRGADTPLAARIRDYCERRGAKLLILDPLGGAYGSDENLRANVRGFLESWNAWAYETDCAVLMLAHPPKADHRYAGSTEWRNAVRALWYLGPLKAEKDENTDPETGKRRPGASMRIGLVADKLSYGRGRVPRVWLSRCRDTGTWQQALTASDADEPKNA